MPPTQQPAALTVAASPRETTPPALAMLERILAAPDLPIERVSQALDLWERVEDRRLATEREAKAQEAERAYVAAMAAATAEIPTIGRDRTNTHTRSRYTTLDAILPVVKPILARHGLSLTSWPIQEAADFVTVWCRIQHVGGHGEERSIRLPLDKGGAQGRTNKTDLQAIGSTQTYGRRYLVCAMLGIPTGDDTDGGGVVDDGPPPRPTIDEATFREVRDLMDRAGVDEAKILAAYGVEALTDLAADAAANLKNRLRATIKTRDAATESEKPEGSA